MHRRAYSISGLALGVALVVSCARVDVRTVAEPGTDFARYRTWAHAPPPWDHPQVGAVVEVEIAKVMAAKGFEQDTLADADLLITYRAHGEPRSRRENAADPDANFYVIQHYIAGVVLIDVFDRRSEKSIWEGVGEIDVLKEADAGRSAALAVREILGRFPSVAKGASRESRGP